MKKILLIIAVAVLIFSAGAIITPQTSYAQAGHTGTFGIGLISEMGIIPAAHFGLVGIDLTFVKYVNFAIGWGPGHFYLHGGYLHKGAVFLGWIVDLSFGIQGCLTLWDAGGSTQAGLAFRIPIEFGFNIPPIPLTLFIGINPKIPIIPQPAFALTISFGFRFYIN